MTTVRDALLDEIKHHAINFGRFILSSGRTSWYYLDCRKVTLSARGAYLVANAFLDLLDSRPVQAVGGMTVAADPIATAIALESWHRQRPLKAFIVRKESKPHGLQRQVEGPIAPGDRAVIVDDVLTTGGSILQAIEAVEAIGVVVDQVMVILDRLEGGRERIQERGYPVTSLFTLDDLRDYLAAYQQSSADDSSQIGS